MLRLTRRRHRPADESPQTWDPSTTWEDDEADDAYVTPPPVVALSGIGRQYLSGDVTVTALQDVDLIVEAGEYVSVVGPSGSGKSTLLNVLGMLDRPTSGSYALDGIEVSTLREADRTAVRGRSIGFVFQAFHLLSHRSVLENVAIAMLYTGVPAAERLARAADALDAVGIGHRASFRPTQLSGGERQRVAIARAIVTRPALLLADEPTGNLDSRTSDTVLELFDELRQGGLTIVMITHDSAVAARADRSVRIRDGRLTAGVSG